MVEGGGGEKIQGALCVDLNGKRGETRRAEQEEDDERRKKSTRSPKINIRKVGFGLRKKKKTFLATYHDFSPACARRVFFLLEIFWSLVLFLITLRAVAAK